MITLRFTTSDSFVSKAIRWICFSDFSHVEIMDPGAGFIAAHAGDGVQLRPFDYDPKAKSILALVRCDEIVTEKVLEFARLQIGKKYDYGAIWGILMRHETPANDRWFCSELVDAAFNHAKYPLVNTAEREGRVTPGDLYNSPLIELLSRACKCDTCKALHQMA